MCTSGSVVLKHDTPGKCCVHWEMTNRSPTAGQPGPKPAVHTVQRQTLGWKTR